MSRAVPSEADFEATLARIRARQHATARRLGALTLVPLIAFLALSVAAVQQGRSAARSVEAAAAAQALADQQRAAARAALGQLAATRDTLARARASLDAGRMAINLFHAGRYADAVRAYDEALRADPTNAVVLNFKGYAQFRAGDLDSAAATLRRGVRAQPDYGYGFFDLARVECARGRMDDALAAAGEALRLRPDLRAYMLANDGEFVRLCRPILARLSAR